MVMLSILILIVAIALPSFQQNLSSIMITRITSIIFFYAGILSLNGLFIESIGSGLGIYSGLFNVTVTSQFIDSFICFIAGSILIAWPTKTEITISTDNNDQSSNIKSTTLSNPCTEYSLIVMFSTLGSSLLISSSDLISMYLSIELQSFGVYILSTLFRNSESSTSAGLKYFLLGGLSSCFILLGSALIYSFSGLTNFEAIYSLVNVTIDNQVIQGLTLGFIIVFVGFLFKVAAAPLHNWAPDVYNDTPTIVTIWLTIMPKIAILFLLLELQSGVSYNSLIDLVESLNSLNLMGNFVSENIIYLLKNLLLISSLLSLIIGTVVGLAQTQIKRLLAYSTISHIGFILLALAVNTEQSIESFVFYIVQYSITNLNVFLIIIALGYVMYETKNNNQAVYGSNSDIKFISQLKGQFFANPILSISLSICFFSMAGVPPLLGFFSKQFVLYSAVQNGYYFMSIVAILTSVISASYYLKIIRVLHTETESSAESQKLDNLTFETSLLSNTQSFLISSLTLLILLFVLKPSIILNSTQLLALSLFNT